MMLKLKMPVTNLKLANTMRKHQREKAVIEAKKTFLTFYVYLKVQHRPMTQILKQNH